MRNQFTKSIRKRRRKVLYYEIETPFGMAVIRNLINARDG